MHLLHDPEAPAAAGIAFEDFLKCDIRIGTVVEVQEFPEARKPSYRLLIDFGPAIGHKKSCAQIVANYEVDDLIGRQIAAVINFPPRQVGPAMSEVLTLGFTDDAGEVVLFAPDKPVPNGSRLF
ncbi:MAG: tRNA-binding protein [Sphingomonadaceae bacterium]